MEPITSAPAIVAGDVYLEGTVSDAGLTYALRSLSAGPLTHGQWLGSNSAEWLLAGVPVNLSDMVEARLRVRIELAQALRQRGVSVRAIAAHLGVTHPQVIRWLRA